MWYEMYYVTVILIYQFQLNWGVSLLYLHGYEYDTQNQASQKIYLFLYCSSDSFIAVNISHVSVCKYMHVDDFYPGSRPRWPTDCCTWRSATMETLHDIHKPILCSRA